MRTQLTFRRRLLTKERLSGGQVRDDEPTALGEVREEARHALGLIADALAESGTAGWASYGTLLGLVRRGDVIAHDDDLDFAARPGSDPGAPVRSMQARGFSLTEQTTVPQGVMHQKFGLGKIEMNVYYLKMQHCELVDEWTAYEHSVVHGRHRQGGTILRRFGSLELPIPENPEAYLKVMYGPEWRVPVTRWHPIHSPPQCSARPSLARHHAPHQEGHLLAQRAGGAAAGPAGEGTDHAPFANRMTQQSRAIRRDFRETDFALREIPQ